MKMSENIELKDFAKSSNELSKLPTKFSVKDLSETEGIVYRKMINESFFYRGHPAALVVAGITYVGLTRKIPFMSNLPKFIVCFTSSLGVSAVARDSYMPTMQKKVVEDLPPNSYLRLCVENGLVFKPLLFKGMKFQKDVSPSTNQLQDEIEQISFENNMNTSDVKF